MIEHAMPTDPSVDAWFDSYDNPMRPAVQRVREIILAADHRVTEAVRWQAPTFVYKGNIASFYPTARARQPDVPPGRQDPGRPPHPRRRGRDVAHRQVRRPRGRRIAPDGSGGRHPRLVCLPRHLAPPTRGHDRCRAGVVRRRPHATSPCETVLAAGSPGGVHLTVVFIPCSSCRGLSHGPGDRGHAGSCGHSGREMPVIEGTIRIGVPPTLQPQLRHAVRRTGSRRPHWVLWMASKAPADDARCRASGSSRGALLQPPAPCDSRACGRTPCAAPVAGVSSSSWRPAAAVPRR